MLNAKLVTWALGIFAAITFVLCVVHYSMVGIFGTDMKDAIIKPIAAGTFAFGALLAIYFGVLMFSRTSLAPSAVSAAAIYWDRTPHYP